MAGFQEMTMQKINTWMDPACDKFTMFRAEYTLEFILNNLSNGDTVLDIGPSNPVGNKIANELNMKIFNTSGDLDLPGWEAPNHKYDIVFCFEMMEHLMSPKFFLTELRKYLNGNSRIFFSYPSRPHWLWTPQHFHEYSRKRFTYLLSSCGYEILSWERRYFPQPFHSRFFGIRPFFRQFMNFDNLVYAKAINDIPRNEPYTQTRNKGYS